MLDAMLPRSGHHSPFWADFAKTNHAENSDKYFRLQVNRDLLGDFSIFVEKGRCQSSYRTVVRGFTNQNDAEAEFIRLCHLRLSHGYDLRAMDAPRHVMQSIVSFIRRGGTTLGSERSEALFLQTILKSVRDHLIVLGEDEMVVSAFQYEIEAVDPQRTRAETTNTTLFEEPDVLSSIMKNTRLRSTRYILRYFIDKLTNHDPRLRRALVHALNTDWNCDGDNVVNFNDWTGRNRHMDSIHILEAFSLHSSLESAAFKMLDNGFQRLSCLRRCTRKELREQAQLNSAELDEADRVLAQYGLRLRFAAVDSVTPAPSQGQILQSS